MVEITNNPLVSVAMVTYNSEKYVQAAIESALASSYTNFELIISDDSSTDDTWSIINKYKDQRIRPFRNEPNIGEYSNRNKCIDLAKGKYIVYLDGDDYIYPHGLEFMVKFMEKYPNAVMGLSRPYDPRFIYPKILTPIETISSQYFYKSVLNLSLARNIIKTEILKKEGRFSTSYIAGDYHMRLNIGSKYPVLLIVDGLIWWRQHADQATGKLAKGDVGVIESYNIDLNFLNSYAFKIDGFNVQAAINERKKKLIPIIFKHILKLRFIRALRLIILIVK